MAHKLLPILYAAAIGVMVLAVVLAFAAYRRPEMMLFLFSTWNLCM